MSFAELILSCWINTDPDLLFVPDPPNSIPLVVETKSKNRVLAACMPQISEPAERGTLECCDATEDHFSPSGWMIWGCGCRWQWVEAGSPLMQVCLSLAAVHPRPNSRFHSNPPPPPPPSLLFQSVPSSQTSIFPEDLVSRPTPPALLQAGHSDRTIAGPLARELAESISSQQTGAGLQPCCHEKQAGQTEDGECDTCYSQNIMYYILLVSLTVNCLCRVNSHITFTKITSEVRFCILKQKLPSPQMNLVSPDYETYYCHSKLIIIISLLFCVQLRL